MNPDAIDTIRLASSLPTENIPQLSAIYATGQNVTSRNSMDAIPKRTTKAVQLAEMERRIHELEEENYKLKHPGTASLALILRYPVMKTKQPEQTKKRKTFPFSRLLTDEEIKKDLENRAYEAQKWRRKSFIARG